MSATRIADPAHSLTPSGNLRRRMVVSRVFEGGAVAAAVLAVAVLVIVVYYVAKKGIGAISWSFLTGDLPATPGLSGGIGPAIVGTAELMLISALIATPVGVLTALYLTEFAGPRLSGAVSMLLDLMNGLPTIVTAVFVFGLLENGGQETALAAAVALAIIMIPLIARATLEALRRVPATLREAADALGVSHWRTVIGVIVPSSLSAIVTATILAVARAAGETAPVLILLSLYGPTYQLDPTKAMPNLPFQIFTLVESGYDNAVSQAWGAAFVLLTAILIANIGARTLVGRAARKYA
jgi:phosphate transport system permease protein